MPHIAEYLQSLRNSRTAIRFRSHITPILSIKIRTGLSPEYLQTIKHLWYDDNAKYHEHYNLSRYRCLNLYPVFTDNNIEVRAFNSSLNAGVLRAYISLVLAVSNQALTQKSASPRVTHSENPRYTFRCWLIRIGLNGDEFKNCRNHLLSHLEGNVT